jgi:predicted ATPase
VREIDRFVVITGGPGAGKTTLIEVLAAGGLCHMPEAGRAIIQDQVAIGGHALPWSDRGAFAELMLAWELRSHRAARELPGTVIFDRGVPDVIGYLLVNGLPVPAHMQRAAILFRYHPRVFIAPPWPEIFAHDAERKQTLAEAEATHRAMSEVYASLGYELMPLPRASASARAAFVREHIGWTRSCGHPGTS